MHHLLLEIVHSMQVVSFSSFGYNNFIFMYPISGLLGYVSLNFKRSSRSKSELSFKLNPWYEELVSGS